MSELQVTQCPFCKTHFRLTQEQLQAAAGNVRCGACLKVFNALPAGQARSAAEPAAASQAVDKKQTLLIHDDLELDELDLEALGLDESILDELTPREAPPKPASFELLDDEESELTLAETARRDDERVEPGFSSLDSDDELELNEAFMATPRARDFAPVFASRPEPEDEPEPEAEPPAKPARAHQVPLQDTDNSAIFRRGQPEGPLYADDASADTAKQPESEENTDDERGRTEPRLDTSRVLPELEDEPLQLAAPLSRRRARSNLLWGALCLLAVLGLAAQAVYYNFDAWARDNQLRPVMQDICLVAGCQLPARVDISQIRSSNLLVRPHPEFPNSLDINVIIYNRADYSQPFPVIRMQFSNSRGETVSSKDFRPEEYLAGELAGRNLMPSQTPIHIALNMVAPGSAAVSYQLDFVAP
ncbi:hypothetical protein CNQ84_03060 [Pseudomonas abyssi]|jgi:predicted Zn finger-like uncharacterized protein|uniref:Zinc finger/thioredoxin putative domain-containing protein n=1 Tax=Pseudomonas abyssi TaxID=170540 RepID=A0A2A3MKZ8_9PSED|nr:MULTISPECIES: zinc-ribbon and DUF3426 domain-containing protein [Pseudomonadaceae]PBK05499.1 hypothetical protein CNQ84_03060 [Pseudomonas abyssi]|tara:strand:+ start:14424 stop:15677 length:1254 start_codon:yes stop_codon:yes gene_type:complete